MLNLECKNTKILKQVKRFNKCFFDDGKLYLRVSHVSARIFLGGKVIVRIESVWIRAIRGDIFVLLPLQNQLS